MSAVVVVYSMHGCQGCRLTARALTAAGISFDTVYIEDNPAAAQLLRALNFNTAPVVFTGSAWWSGFQPDRIKQLA